MDSDYGLLIYSNDLYNFYTNSIPEIDTFYLAIPKDNGNEFSLYVNMPDKELFYEYY